MQMWSRSLVARVSAVVPCLLPTLCWAAVPSEEAAVTQAAAVQHVGTSPPARESQPICSPEFSDDGIASLGIGSRASLGAIDGGVALAWVTVGEAPSLITAVLPAGADTPIQTAALAIPGGASGHWSLLIHPVRADVIGLHDDPRSGAITWLSSAAGAHAISPSPVDTAATSLVEHSIAEFPDRCLAIFSLSSAANHRLVARVLDCWSGQPLDREPTEIASAQRPISAISSARVADRLLVTYLVDDGNGSAVWSLVLTASGQRLAEPRRLSQGTVRVPARIASDGDRAFAAWVENADSLPVLRFGRLEADPAVGEAPRTLAVLATIPSALRVELSSDRAIVGLRTARSQGDDLILLSSPLTGGQFSSRSYSLGIPGANLLDWAGTPEQLTLLVQQPDGSLATHSSRCGVSPPATFSPQDPVAPVSSSPHALNPPVGLVELENPVPAAPVSLAAAPDDAAYLTASANAALSAERVLTAGDGIQTTDAGANSTLTVALKDCAANEVLRRNAADSAWICAPLLPDALAGSDGVTINPDADADGTALITIQDRAITVAPSTGPHRQFDVDGNDGDPAEFLFVTEAVQSAQDQGTFPVGNLGAGIRIISDDVVAANTGAFLNFELGSGSSTPGESAQLVWVNEDSTSGDNVPSFGLRTRIDLDNDGTFDAAVNDKNDFADPFHIFASGPKTHSMIITPVNNPAKATAATRGQFGLSFKGTNGGQDVLFRIQPDEASCPAANYGPNSWRFEGGISSNATSSAVCVGGIPDRMKSEVIHGAWAFDYNPEPAWDFSPNNAALYTTGSIHATEGFSLGAFFGRNAPEGTIRGGQTDPNGDGTTDQYITLHDPFADPFDYTGYGRFEVRTWAGVDPAGSGWTRSGSFRIDGWVDLDSDTTIEPSEPGRVTNEVGPLVQGAIGFDGGVEFTADGSTRMRVWSRLCGPSTQWVIDLDADGSAEATDLCLGDEGVSADCDCTAEWLYGAGGTAIDPDDDGTAELLVLTDGTLDWDMDGTGSRPYCGTVTVDPGPIASLTKGTATATVAGLPSNLTCECHPTVDWADTVAPNTGDDLLQQHCSTGGGILNVRLYNAGGAQLDGDSRTVRYCCWNAD